MNLGRLLAAGRSLVGARNGPGRYRVNNQITLPKFISPHNPFTTPAESATPSLGAPEPGIRVEAGPGARIKSRLGLARARLSGLAKLVTHWFQKGIQGLNPLSRSSKWPSLCDSRHCARPELTKKPLQPELSLDTVRVVHNDLSDADFEIVPNKTSVTGVSGKQASVRSERLAPVGKTWNRLTAKIFGVGQT